MGTIRYSCPIRLVLTYILPAKDIRFSTCKRYKTFGKVQPDSLKTERLLGVETDGQTNMPRSTRLVMLIRFILVYTYEIIEFKLHTFLITFKLILYFICLFTF